MVRRCLAAPTYQRRQPEQTVLYRTIATHLPTFFARPAWEDGTGGWPAFVRREFEAYLKCGRLEHGLLRVQCERCRDTTVVAFSCRGRGFCPSCGGRRMSELAAHQCRNAWRGRIGSSRPDPRSAVPAAPGRV
jgi:hypothetical protein